MSYKSCDGVYHPEVMSEWCDEVLKAPPGHFWITGPDDDGVRFIHMKLPSNREEGAYCAIPIKHGPGGGGGRNPWGWDGNMEHPTLTPSIFHDFDRPQSSVAWHGFLRAGRFEGC
jgi:hypothetical protein